MPEEELLGSMQTTASNIGRLMELPEEATKLLIKETASGQCLILPAVIKEIVESHDVRKVLSFTRTDEESDVWILDADKLRTEKYQLLGILATAYMAIDTERNVTPWLERIQECLEKTLAKIRSDHSNTIVATPTFHKDIDHKH